MCPGQLVPKEGGYVAHCVIFYLTSGIIQDTILPQKWYPKGINDMDKEIAKQIIRESQEVAVRDIVPREIEVPLSSRKIIAITGPRRSGKTYLVFSLMNNLTSRGVPPERILYVSFDDPRTLPSGARDIETILEAYRELYPEHIDKTNYIFFDEIQNVQEWELGVRRIYDTGKFRIFITGSSSRLLSKEIATRLRGRAVSFEILPFSFREVLLAKGVTLKRDTAYSQERFVVKKHLDAYLKMGGFPEVVLEPGADLRIRILKEYLETRFFRDLIERFRVKNQQLLRELIRHLVTNTASLFSLNAFYKWIKGTYPVTKRTLLNYVSYLEEIGLFCLVRKFSYSLKEQVQTPRKCYVVDSGFRTVYGFSFSEDRGRVLENAVFLELKHRQVKDPMIETFYWRDYQKREVDFVVRRGRKVAALVQVCADVENPKTRERETASLVRAGKELKCKDLLVITFDYDKVDTIEDREVVFKPIWKWLIGS